MTISIGIAVYWRMEGYNLRAGILIWTFTFYARKSKPESLLNSSLTLGDRYTYIIWRTWSTHTWENQRGVFAMIFFTNGSWQIQPDFFVCRRRENQSLQASDLVWSSTFNARGSKPNYLLARTTINVTIKLISFNAGGKKRECLSWVLSTNGNW